jgi:hypothetical protein
MMKKERKKKCVPTMVISGRWSNEKWVSYAFSLVVVLVIDNATHASSFYHRPHHLDLPFSVHKHMHTTK